MPPCISARAAGRRRTRSTTRSGSCSARSAAISSRTASRSPDVHARTEDDAEVARARSARGVRDRGRAARRAARPARRRRLSRRRYGGAMPELPEVETVRRRIAPVLEGRRFERVDDRRPAPDASRGPGRRSRASSRASASSVVDRRGKYLIVRFESGRALLIHLRMTGSVLHGAGADGRRPAPPRGGRARRRLARRLPGRPALRHLAPARARRGRRRTSTRASAVSRSAPPTSHGTSPRARGPARRRSRRRCSTSAPSRASATSTPTRRSGARASTR